jgi:hypothetical protein
LADTAEYRAAMHARYGFGLFSLPRYRDARAGEWRIVQQLPSLAAGYVTGPRVEAHRYVLYRGGIAWMSTSILEQESHAFHVSQATGDVVTAGLGMGMFVYAAAIRPEVRRIIVIEQSPEVKRVMADATEFDRWPERSKVVLVEGDVAAPDLSERVSLALGGGQPDYLFVDIWSVCADPAAPRQAAELVTRLRPRRAGWWGQELSFGRWCSGILPCAVERRSLQMYWVKPKREDRDEKRAITWRKRFRRLLKRG